MRECGARGLVAREGRAELRRVICTFAWALLSLGVAVRTPAVAQSGPGKGYYIADSIGKLKISDQGPGTFTMPKDAKLTVAERKSIGPRSLALVKAFADQPWLNPPVGFDAEFSQGQPYTIGAGTASYTPLIYNFSFGAFNYYYRAGRRGPEPFREVAQNLTGVQVNVPPDHWLAPKEGPIYDIDPRVFAHPERDTSVAGFAVYRGEIMVTRLDLEKFWKPVTLEFMLRAMLPLLAKDRDGERATLVGGAAAARATYNAADWAKLQKYHADEVAAVTREYARNDKAREQQLASLERRWVKDSLSRVGAMEPDTNGRGGERYRAMRDSVAAIEARLQSMSAEERSAPACGMVLDHKVALNYWELHAAGYPGTGSRRCYPLVTLSMDGWRTDLSRTAFQLIRAPSGYSGKCLAEIVDPERPKTNEPGGCVANVRLVRRVEWTKVAALLEH